MDWLDKMNRALDFIEGNLTDEIDYNQAAQKALCSAYHFQRMFSFITGITLSEYIRRRRLTLAAFDLQEGKSVTETAIKYGYDSVEAFTRAFKKQHEATPSSVRKQGIVLTAYPRISFHISIRGDREMKYSILEKPSFTVFGESRRINRGSVILNDPGDEVNNFWGEMIDGGSLDKICSLSPGENILAMMWHGYDGEVFYYDENIMPYLIGTYKKDNTNTVGYTEVCVPAATWAVFPTEVTTYFSGKMPEYIRSLCDRIFSEWFPTSGYEHAQLPELEVYHSYDDGMREWCEIWMPVNKLPA